MNINAKSPFKSRFLSPMRAALLLGLAALALTACTPQASELSEPPLAGADIGGAFSLTSSTGDTVTWDDFRGKYAVVYFGYAYCPDVCPTDMQRTAQGLREFAASDAARADKIQAVFITIDPERDTPEVVGEFAAAFSEDLIGLTGSPEAIKAAADAFRVYYKKGEQGAGGGYLVDHTNIVYLFDPAGEPLAMLPTSDGAEAVAAELAKWVE